MDNIVSKEDFEATRIHLIGLRIFFSPAPLVKPVPHLTSWHVQLEPLQVLAFICLSFWQHNIFCRLSTLDSLWNGDLICARGERASRSTGALRLCGALLSIQRRDALLSRKVDWVSPLRIILVLLILCFYWQLPQPQVKLLFLLVFFLLVVPSRAWDDDVGQAGSDHAAVVPEIFPQLQQRIEQVKWCWKHQLWTFEMLYKLFPDARLISPWGITTTIQTWWTSSLKRQPQSSILNPHGLLKPVPGVAVFVRHKENTSFPAWSDSAHNLKKRTC